MNKRLATSSIITILVISGVFAWFIPDLEFNYVLEDFFPTDDPDLELYEQFKNNFSEDNNYLLIALNHEPSIFDSSFLANLSALTDSIESLNQTESVRSLADISIPVISPTGLLSVPFIHPDDPSKYANDSVRIYNSQWIPGTWISRDATSVLIVVSHEFFYEKPRADDYLSEIKAVINEAQYTDYKLAGKIHAQQVYVNKMKGELVLFVGCSIVLVLILLTIIYRSIWAVVVPLIVVGLSVVWLAGFMALTGKPFDLLMVLMPTILFVVGMSDVVHILSRYLEELRNGNGKIAALKITLKEIGLATFLTSVTTSIGFITLLTASISPLREFGLYIAIGVFFAYIIAFTLLPAVLFFLKRPKITKEVHLREKWNKWLGIIFIWIFHHKRSILIIFATLIVLSCIGIYQIKINSYLIEDLPEGDSLKQDFLFFDEKFGGSRPLEIIVTLNDTSASVFDKEVIVEINKVEHVISSSLPTNFLLSPVFLIKLLNQGLAGGSSNAFSLPENEESWGKVKSYANKMINRPEVTQLLSEDRNQARITGRMDDIGSRITLQKSDEINQKIKDTIDEDVIQVQLTGSSLLIDKNNQYLVENMIKGLAIAIGVVAIIAGLMFLEWRMILIALLPNILPLLITAGIMGFADIPMKLSTSMVFTIAFGIAVDDTIHFLSKLRIELSKGKSVLYAMKRSYLSTGKAITITTLILSGGFLILLFSSFGGTFYTGLLVGLTLLFALVVDLVLLPILILMFYPISPTTLLNKQAR